MSPLWAYIGPIIAAAITALGVVLAARAANARKPSSLAESFAVLQQAYKDQAESIDKWEKKHAELEEKFVKCKDEMEATVKKYEGQITMLQAQLFAALGKGGTGV